MQQKLQKFQLAPTLGGECYVRAFEARKRVKKTRFNGHPPLGVNATSVPVLHEFSDRHGWFQWAPTLGGECYLTCRGRISSFAKTFQWAPTLGGECYGIVYLITPPLCQGVNALLNISPRF